MFATVVCNVRGSDADGRDKRRSERYPTLMRAELRVELDREPTGWAVIANLSRTGILVATEVRAATGQTVYFSFRGAGIDCLAVGTVITNRDGAGFVVEFQGETAEMKAFFDQLERLDPAAQWELMQSIDRGTLEIV